MKKYILLFTMTALSAVLFAVPARRGFHDYLLDDGTTVSLTLAGDEYAHWYESAAGTVYTPTSEGTFVPAGVTRMEMADRRKASVRYQSTQQRRARKDFGKTPNLAPRGVVILVNFSDSKMSGSHTQSTFDELCNSTNCTVNSGYPSAAEYFNSQSFGAYRPVFDVYGPVTLSKGYAYYGKNVGEGDDAEDEYATDAVIEACILANEQNSNLNFANYDSDNDGYVDFVYVIYAGKGEADGGVENTIWPHNWSIQELVTNYSDYTNYSKSQTKLDGVYLDNYAMSSELEGSGTLGGIGTLCHEFGHVMGLPDFYDTNYKTNYTSNLTPNDWDIMDGGSYNGDGHCPPNYSPWERYFFGWHTPVNLGSEGAVVELTANGRDGYQAYQINASGTQQTATTSGECYYIENRQAQGWDAPLTGHGMLIWKVNYDASKWANNEPNNTANKPLYTIVSASGTQIGYSRQDKKDYCPKNPYPGTASVTSKTIADKPLLNIAEKNGVVSLIYIEEPTEPVDPFELTWMSNGQEFATTTSTGKVVMPSGSPEACDGKVFAGWCKIATYSSASEAPSFVNAGDAAAEGDIYYAVFATKDSEGGAEETTTYTFTSKSWADGTNSWTSTQDGYQYNNDNQGIQITANASGAGAETNKSYNNVIKVVVKYCTNASRGAGSVAVSVGDTKKSQDVTKSGGTSLRDLTYTFDKASGKVAIEVTCTTNSIYINSVAVTSAGGVSYRDYTTSCSGTTALERPAADQPSAVKAIRNGEVVILRGDATYTVLGVKK
ncbi:MAG: M6 family metalloprotease domain-containing protein [Paludibacteraceae bacterium]|nr:M6 family metalloprotease domain-containing protein [Paludibacteraceae bacterium]